MSGGSHRATVEDLREGGVADLLREREEVVLDGIGHHQVTEIPRFVVAAEKEHRGAATIASHLGRPRDQPGDGRIAPEDPVAAAQLEPVPVTLVRRANPSWMIETLEDAEAARHPGGETGHPTPDDPFASSGLPRWTLVAPTSINDTRLLATSFNSGQWRASGLDRSSDRLTPPSHPIALLTVAVGPQVTSALGTALRSWKMESKA